MEWFEYGRLWVGQGATALCFDDRHDLVWVGRRDGIVEAHDLGTSPYDELHCNDAFLQRHCSFRLSAEAAPQRTTIPCQRTQVRSMQPIGEALGMQGGGVLSMNSARISMHTAGGICLASASMSRGKLVAGSNTDQSRPVSAVGVAATEEDGILCGTFLEGTSNVAVGCRSDVIHVLDATSGLRCVRVVRLSEASHSTSVSMDVGTTCISNHASRVLVTGGADGKVRVLDSQFRSREGVVTKAFDAYSGAVTAVACKSNTVATAGSNSMSRNRSFMLDRHAKGLLRMTQDPSLKLFDLRTMRQLPPCPFVAGGAPLHLSAPTMLHFFPGYSQVLVAAAPSGAMLFLDPIQVAAGVGANSTQYFQVKSDDGLSPPGLECIAVSSNGNLIAVGSGETGAVALWGGLGGSLSHCNSEGLYVPLVGRPGHDRRPLGGVETKLMEASPFVPRHRPLAAPSPPCSLTVDIPAPAAHYCINPGIHVLQTDPSVVVESLSSSVASFATNGWGRYGFQDHVLLGEAQHSLHPSLTPGVNPTGTESGLPVGTLNLPKLLPHRYWPYASKVPKPNGMYFGELQESIWFNTDPRKGDEAAATLLRQQRDMVRVLTGKVGLAADIEAAATRSMEAEPENYYLPTIRVQFPSFLAAKDILGKYGFVDEAQYEARNRTAHSGLESLQTHPDAAYSNAIVQLLYFIPELRESLIREQFRRENYAHNRGLAVELGFLLHMLDTTAQATARDGRGRSAQPTNFLRAFRREPRTVALGLTSRASESKRLPINIRDADPSVIMAAAASAVARTGVNCGANVGSMSQVKVPANEPDATTLAAMVAARTAVAALSRSRAISTVFNGSNESLSAISDANPPMSSNTTLTLTCKAEAFLRFMLTVFDQELSQRDGVDANRKLVEFSEGISNGATIIPLEHVRNFSGRSDPLAGARCGLAGSFGSIFESRNEFVNAAFARDNSAHASYTVITELCYPPLHVLKNMGLLVDPPDVSSCGPDVANVGRPPPAALSSRLGERAGSVISFAEILRNSLCKQQRTKAFSDTAAAENAHTDGSGTSNYQPILQRRYPKTLPGVLAINCAATNASDGSGLTLWRGTNALGGNWLPRRLQIQLHQSTLNDDEDRVVVAEFVEEALPPSAASGEREECTFTSSKPFQDGQWAMVDRARCKGDRRNPAMWLADGTDMSNTGSSGCLTRPHSSPSTALDFSSRPLNNHGCGSNRRKEEQGDGGLGKGSEPYGRAPALSAAPPRTAAVLGGAQVKQYELLGIVSHVRDNPRSVLADGHLICHISAPAARATNAKNGVGEIIRDVDLQGSKRAGDIDYGGMSHPAHAAYTSEVERPLDAGSEKEWVLFNDFVVEYCSTVEVLSFHDQHWREPCCVVYREVTPTPRDGAATLPNSCISDAANSKDCSGQQYHADSNMRWNRAAELADAKLHQHQRKSNGEDSDLREQQQIRCTDISTSENEAISSTVFDVESLSVRGGTRHLGPSRNSHFTFQRIDHRHLFDQGHPIAIDTEFVTVAEEDAVLNSDGSRSVSSEARQALARVSAVDGRTGTVIIDDYVLPTEPVVDYKTRFSGLTREDLDPAVSPHHIVHLRTTYLKLRHLVDRGCIFVGHGLKTDFRVVNIFVPPHQIGDTLELWSLPEQRKLSLRFLGGCLLEANIQGETHDSIEDAKAALELYMKYKELQSSGGEALISKTLKGLYAYGYAHDWKYDARDPFLDTIRSHGQDAWKGNH